MSNMRKLELSDLSRLAEELKNGETIALLLNGQVVAHVEPVREARAPKKLPEWFFTRPLVESPSGSVLDQLLDDRKSRDW